LLAQCLKNRDFLEKGEAENLQDFAEAPLQPEFLFDDRDEHVRGLAKITYPKYSAPS
jgi:hypothetical protein